MMRLTDAMMLAYTKLRTRKIRLFFALLTASLLFSVLVAGSLIVSGALTSLESFSKEGFSNRYIVAGMYQTSTNNDSVLLKPELIARAEQLEKADIAAKKAAAKKLNIPYDDAAIPSDSRAVFNDFKGDKSINTASKFGLQAIEEAQSADPNKSTLEKFKKQVGAANHFYTGVTRAPFRIDSPALTLIKDGEEKRNTDGSMGAGGFGMGGGSSAGLKTVTSEWSLLDKELLQPFVLKGQTLDVGSDGSLPIVTTYTAAQEVLKLPKLSADASAKDKKARLEQVRSQIAGKTFQVCYRNATSSADLQNAIQQQDDLKRNTGKAGYEKPRLVYAPSSTPCGAPVIVSDTRSSEEKTYQQRQDQFDRQFGKVDAASQLVTFRIVGVTQDSPFSSGSSGGGMFNASEAVSMLTISTLGVRWVSPLSVEAQSVPAQDVFKRLSANIFGFSQEGYFAEYSDAPTARTVLSTKTCRSPYGDPAAEGASKVPICSANGSSFMLQPFGSASLAIDEFKHGFRTAQLWAALVIAVFASIILIGVIGRIIADARKETAVFRATGATRLMIAQIYLVYTLYLVVLIVLVSLALGFGAALALNSAHSANAGINMALLFNVEDLSKPFLFYHLELYDLGLIAAAVLVAAIVGASVPIAGNIQRNPIRDMRDE